MAVNDQTIMDVLAQRLGVSVQNLCESLAVPLNELTVCLERLKREGRIRTARSPCSGSCASCGSSCGEPPSSSDAFTPDTVVISLERPIRS
jgi:predicted transcriptional regulator